MTQAKLEVRKERSENGALIASGTEEGFRVYAVRNPSKVYLVQKDGDQRTCTCPDFEFHTGDTTWRCKHVLAVAPWPKPEETLPVEVEFDDPTEGLTLPESPAPDQLRRKQVRKEAAASEPGNGQASEIPAAAGGENLPPVQEKTLVQEKSGPPKPGTPKRARRVANGSAQMLIKRSVSPDGRIDSVSVEFSMPVADISNGEIKDKALKTMQLQKEIVGAFLKLNGQKVPAKNAVQNPQPSPPEKSDGPVFARMIDIGRVNGKWGERLCINVQVGDRRCRLFGSADQLALQIARAGFHVNPEDIEDGRRLNVACLVVTKPSDAGQ